MVHGRRGTWYGTNRNRNIIIKRYQTKKIRIQLKICQNRTYSSKKISKGFRTLIIIGLILLAILFAIGGKFLLTLPITLASLALLKLKGLSIFQLISLYRLIQTLRKSGRFFETYIQSSKLLGNQEHGRKIKTKTQGDPRDHHRTNRMVHGLLGRYNILLFDIHGGRHPSRSSIQWNATVAVRQRLS